MRRMFSVIAATITIATPAYATAHVTIDKLLAEGYEVKTMLGDGGALMPAGGEVKTMLSGKSGSLILVQKGPLLFGCMWPRLMGEQQLAEGVFPAEGVICAPVK